ncbi:MAG: hypothetical protein QG635_1853 [Bacteroidota bacterium]|nr:hypothetical protein [Bacteroidota bacterium]
MKLKGLLSCGIAGVILSSSLFFTSCTPKVTEEQLQQLKSLYEEESGLSKDIIKKKSEKSSIETELKNRTSELTDCTSKRDFIKSKLATWPDSWTDWHPAPPDTTPPPPPEKKSKGRKK